jgi:ABC-type antimicrobial peptide transport system permease subunit
VGTWASLRRARSLDDDGNGVVGTAHFVDADSNIVHGESGVVVLYGVSKIDPAALGVAVASLAACALTAALVPAIRAAKLDPVRALRTE